MKITKTSYHETKVTESFSVTPCCDKLSEEYSRQLSRDRLYEWKVCPYCEKPTEFLEKTIIDGVEQ